MGNLSCLLYLVDVASSKRYLVDSGSAYSILPHRSSAEPTGPMPEDSRWRTSPLLGPPYVHCPHPHQGVLLELPAGSSCFPHTRS